MTIDELSKLMKEGFEQIGSLRMSTNGLVILKPMLRG